MQVQSVNNQYNMNFETRLSRSSASIIKPITKELRTNILNLRNKTAEANYQKKDMISFFNLMIKNF